MATPRSCDLAAAADIVVENFRAEVKHRLRVDYESVKAVNKAIIYASISGFGQEGPYGSRPGVDQIVQGMSGLMSITGTPESGPMRVGIAISDTAAGMFLGQGILLALLHRERTGEGQWVHTSLLEAMLNKIDFQGARYTMLGEVPGQQGNHHPVATPMGTYACRNGLVNIAASSIRMWKSFCRAVDAEHLLHAEKYATFQDRARNKASLTRDIEAVIADLTVEELIERLNPVGVPCGPVNNIAQGVRKPPGEVPEDDEAGAASRTRRRGPDPITDQLVAFPPTRAVRARRAGYWARHARSPPGVRFFRVRDFLAGRDPWVKDGARKGDGFYGASSLSDLPHWRQDRQDDRWAWGG